MTPVAPCPDLMCGKAPHALLTDYGRRASYSCACGFAGPSVAVGADPMDDQRRAAKAWNEAAAKRAAQNEALEKQRV